MSLVCSGGSINQRCSFALGFGKTCSFSPSPLGASGSGFHSRHPTATNMGNLGRELGAELISDSIHWKQQDGVAFKRHPPCHSLLACHGRGAPSRQHLPSGNFPPPAARRSHLQWETFPWGSWLKEKASIVFLSLENSPCASCSLSLATFRPLLHEGITAPAAALRHKDPEQGVPKAQVLPSQNKESGIWTNCK